MFGSITKSKPIHIKIILPPLAVEFSVGFDVGIASVSSVVSISDEVDVSIDVDVLIVDSIDDEVVN